MTARCPVVPRGAQVAHRIPGVGRPRTNHLIPGPGHNHVQVRPARVHQVARDPVVGGRDVLQGDREAVAIPIQMIDDAALIEITNRYLLLF